MKHAEIRAMMAEIAPVIREFTLAALEPVLARVSAVEARFAALPMPKDGKDAEPEKVAAIVLALEGLKSGNEAIRADTAALRMAITETESALASHVVLMDGFRESFRQPKDGENGTSVTIADVAPMILDEVSKAVSVIPTPKDGEPGKSVDLTEVEVMVAEKVAAAVAALPVPENGKDADPEVIAEMVAAEVAKLPPAENGKDAEPVVITRMVDEAVARIPPARDGESVDPELVKAAIADEVQRAVAALPRPQDGKSVTVDDLRPMVEESAQRTVSAMPVPKDGADVVDLLIDRDGALVATLSNGRTKTLGPVIGKDGERGVDGKDGAPGKDGADGLGFDDLTEELVDDGRTIVHRYSRGDQVKEFRHSIAVVLDRGVFKEGSAYVPGDGVTWGGSFWIAQAETTEKPDSGKGWRLSVKRGRDGKDGIMKPPPTTGPVKVG